MSGIILLAVAANLTLRAPAEAEAKRTDTPTATQVGRYRLQSNPWVNLHQRLIHEARFKTEPPPALSGERLSTWKRAVETHRADEAFVGRPATTTTRMTEENDVVVAEGSVRVERRAGGFLRGVFCDVFEMRGGKIRRLITYFVEIKDGEGGQTP